MAELDQACFVTSIVFAAILVFLGCNEYNKTYARSQGVCARKSSTSHGVANVPAGAAGVSAKAAVLNGTSVNHARMGGIDDFDVSDAAKDDACSQTATYTEEEEKAFREKHGFAAEDWMADEKVTAQFTRPSDAEVKAKANHRALDRGVENRQVTGSGKLGAAGPPWLPVIQRPIATDEGVSNMPFNNSDRRDELISQARKNA